MLVAGIAGTLGMGVGTGRLRGWVELVPPWIRAIAYGAAAAFLLLVVGLGRAGGRVPWSPA